MVTHCSLLYIVSRVTFLPNWFTTKFTTALGLASAIMGKRISQLEGANHFESSPWDRVFFTSFYPFWGFSYWITGEKPWVWRNYSHPLEFEQPNIICIIIHYLENLSVDSILHLWSLILKKENTTLHNLSLQRNKLLQSTKWMTYSKAEFEWRHGSISYEKRLSKVAAPISLNDVRVNVISSFFVKSSNIFHISFHYSFVIAWR